MKVPWEMTQLNSKLDVQKSHDKLAGNALSQKNPWNSYLQQESKSINYVWNLSFFLTQNDPRKLNFGHVTSQASLDKPFAKINRCVFGFATAENWKNLELLKIKFSNFPLKYFARNSVKIPIKFSPEGFQPFNRDFNMFHTSYHIPFLFFLL
jgi:hypothetical protein